MKKLRNNSLFKFIMIFLFVISLLVCAVSGLIAVILYEDHALTKRGRENLKQSIITRIAYADYNMRAVNYYEQYLQGFDCAQDYNFFLEENTNYSFNAKIINADKKYDELTSYVTNDYQYSQTDRYTINLDSYYKSKTMKVTQEDIMSTPAYVCLSNEELSDLGFYDAEIADTSENILYTDSEKNYVNINVVEELREKFYRENNYDYFDLNGNDYVILDDDEIYDLDEIEENDIDLSIPESDIKLDNCFEYGYDGDNDINMVTDGKLYYVLKNIDGVSEYINGFYDYYYDANISYSLYYDSDAEELSIDVYISPVMQVELNWYVKSKLTAYDGFYNSITLRYLNVMTKYAIPVCVISGLIFMICFALLVITAGHKRIRTVGENDEVEITDELRLGWFDKIPYDIVLAAFIVPLFFGIVFLEDAYYGSIESVIAIACAIVCSFFGAFLVMTTSARIKCRGWKFLQGTLTFMMIKGLLYLMGAFFKWLGSILKYFWKHFNLYWKYIVIILCVAAVEIFFAVSEEASATLIVVIIEKIIVSLFAAYALINLNRLKKYTKTLAEGDTEGVLDTEHMHGEFLEYAKDLGHVNDGIKASVEKQMKSEMMKTELITNVSHDIKTPLTSIINYVDLLGKENIESEKAKEYIEVLNRQSQRLKKLIVDLIDASKASTGNVEVNLEKLDLDIILMQLNGEYEEQFEKKKLKLVINNKAKDSHIMADQRHIYRVFDNLFVNIKKYAQEGTRVYVDIDDSEEYLLVSMKNISASELNISGEELMERFTRGDRSRNTEGSGLGLSIAKSLIELQNGRINIIVDGDLFKAELLIPKA